MKSQTISASDFLRGKVFHDCGCASIGKHEYHARWVPGDGIEVTDRQGGKVKVSFAGTTDGRTCYASVDEVGFIGGWQYPHKKMPFKALVESINRGRLYPRMTQLPKTHRPKTCPHCGGEL